MKPELEQQLYDEFPDLFADRNKPETRSLMCYGVGVGDGWYNILHRLCEKIIEIDTNKKFRFFQIKEKFGQLRIYGADDGGTLKIYDLISQAENESSKTCEYCGTIEDVTSSGRWIKTLCAECRKDNKWRN